MTVKKTILCVDDEQSLSIQKVTLQTRGYRVMTCNTAAEAISIFRQYAVDLVMSNLELPDAPATDLATRIKAHSPGIPIILLSAHNAAVHAEAQIDLLLRKGSYAPAELLDRIRALLMKRRGPHRTGPVPLVRGAHAC